MEQPHLTRKRHRSVEPHTVALPSNIWTFIVALAAEQRVSKSDVARYLLDLGIAQYTQQKATT